MHRICIFAGSNLGTRPEYAQAARAMGQALLARGLGIVYGGGNVGIMGVIADTILAGGGEVIGVLPRGLFKREMAHTNLTKLHEVGSMHERKALMADLAEAFIALPGGFGTFDELFEIATWAQLGIHSKPVGLLNVAGYFEPLLALVAHASAEGFILPAYARLLICEDDPDVLLERFVRYTPPATLPEGVGPPPER